MIFKATQPKILVFEYITGGGLQDCPIPKQLAAEGLLMLRALLRDLAELPVTVDLLLDDRILDSLGELAGNINIVRYSARSGMDEFLQELLPGYDAFWPIAPESAGILYKLSKLCERADRVLLNSASDAVATASSKYATLQLLEKAGLTVVPVQRLEQFEGEWPLPWVIKPDCGLDCEQTCRISDSDQVDALFDEPAGEMIIQPYIPGQACSLSMVVHDGKARLICANLLEVRTDDCGEFHFDATRVNGLSMTPEFRHIAAATVRHLPGLNGYVGIDLILQDRQIYLLEVNPRLTTSYAGIHAAKGVNVAALVIGKALQLSLEHKRTSADQVIRIAAVDEGKI